MAKLRTSRYIYSVALMLFALNLNAQQNSEKEEWYGITIGSDLSRFALPFIDSTRFGWEFSGDVELLKDMFVSLELGTQSTNLKKAIYNYNSTGAYTRIGVDYNFMKHVDASCNDKLFVGLRYGYTTFFHKADNIQLFDPVWGNVENIETETKWLGANWLEVNTGMRARIINNFYLGWSVRFKLKLWEGADPHIIPYHIPGYGRNIGNSSIGLNYSLSYQIPFLKKSFLSKLKTKKNDAPTEGAPVD